MTSLEKSEQKFTLKPMVIGRLFAEMTVLVVLIFVPIVTQLTGHLDKAVFHVKAMLWGMALIAAVVLPSYGFITWQVLLNSYGINSRSLFKRQQLPWDGMKGLKLKTSWGWRRYVVEHKDGALTFPVWFGGIKELTQTIRGRLAGGGSGGAGNGTGSGGTKKYSQDIVNMLIQFGKLLISLAFIGLFWLFFASLQKAQAGKADKSDFYIILAMCILLTLVMVLRCIVIALMPKSVTVDPEALTLQTLFSSHRIAWADVTAITAPLFFLPPGLFLKTKRGWYLIGEQLEAVDELEEDLAKRLPKLIS